MCCGVRAWGWVGGPSHPRPHNSHHQVTLIVNDAGAVESQGLPVYNWWSEALHGVGYSPGVKFEEPTTSATSFPQVRSTYLSGGIMHPHVCSSNTYHLIHYHHCQVITTSHSFNPRLVHAIGGAIATEARVFNNHGGHSGKTNAREGRK